MGSTSCTILLCDKGVPAKYRLSDFPICVTVYIHCIDSNCGSLSVREGFAVAIYAKWRK